MRELHIVQQFGQVTVTTSDGRRAVSASVLGALEKLFGKEWAWGPMEPLFLSITEQPDKSNIHRGQAGA